VVGIAVTAMKKEMLTSKLDDYAITTIPNDMKAALELHVRMVGRFIFDKWEALFSDAVTLQYLTICQNDYLVGAHFR